MTPLSDVHIVVLAAGQGTRMRSRIPKVLHAVAGLSMVERVLRATEGVSPTTVTLVVGHGADIVRQLLVHRPNIAFVVQTPQLGTAHALLQAEPVLVGKSGTVLLVSGDVPLLRAETLVELLNVHLAARAGATVLTTEVERPFGYGRVLRESGRIRSIVEERDATPAERQIREINSGIYAFDLPPLFESLRAIAPKNAQGEFYLTDVIGLYRGRGVPVEGLLLRNADEIRGVNSRTELAEVSGLARRAKNEALMAAGVTLTDPATTYIDSDVVVGPDSILHPGVVIEGQTQIGSACEIRPHVHIRDSSIGDGVLINSFCVIVGSRIADNASVGPFAHLRPDTVLAERVKIGNFVELKRTTLGTGSKVNHLSYLGDTTVGEGVNVGAGTITCNYDGQKKSQTVIEDGAFIGSDTQLIAPVRVGKGAYVAAGSSIVEDVPAGALGIARSRQTNISDWAHRTKPAPKR